MPKRKSNLVRALAPEEIMAGSYVVVLHEITQFLPWSFGETPRRAEPVSVRMLPDDPEPLEVLGVCMPFVFAKKPDDELVTLDVRRHQLGRLDGASLRRVLEHLRKKRQEQKEDKEQDKESKS
jgi:hypothetical protein